MSNVTQILSQISAGDSSANARLLPLVYEELRQMASQKMRNEPKGQTLQSTALVHEAYLRLVDSEHQQKWNSRQHFFKAAAQAMRWILIDNARRKQRFKRGGQLQRVDFDEAHLALETRPEELLAIDDALKQLAIHESLAAEIVNLHYFGGFSIEESAKILDVSRATAYRLWTYARAWLRCEIAGND